MSTPPYSPAGSPAPLRNGGPPVFVEHDRDPREEPGLDLPAFSVCAVGADYYRKCGYEPTEWDGPPCAEDCTFELTADNGGVFDFNGATWTPGEPPAALVATFSQTIEPSTVVLGDTVVVTSSEDPDPSAPYEVSVFGNQITVTPTGDPFGDNFNIEWLFGFLAGIESTSGCAIEPVDVNIETVFDD